MSEQVTITGTPPRSKRAFPSAPLLFIAAVVLLCAAFAKPLAVWAGYCWSSELYSYCVLVPFISAYLFWLKKPVAAPRAAGFQWLALVPAAFGAAALLALNATHQGTQPQVVNYLAARIGSLYFFICAAAILTLGLPFVRQAAFPFFFLIFAVPFPTPVSDALMAFLQHGSAHASEALLRLSGMTLFREGTFFALPKFNMEVAPECSGIHSTLALFISSLAAGYMLLSNARSRALLTIAILPLALLRNALRIFTITTLCVYVDPELIHSYIHRRGGPIFFAFSLLPLFILLMYLRSNDSRLNTAPAERS